MSPRLKRRLLKAMDNVVAAHELADASLLSELQLECSELRVPLLNKICGRADGLLASGIDLALELAAA